MFKKKKDDITEEKIEKEFGDLIKKLEEHYTARNVENENVQKIGIKLNKKIDTHKPNLFENIKNLYLRSRSFYNGLFAFLTFMFVGMVGVLFYYKNLPEKITIPEEVALKTQNIPEIALTKSEESIIGVDTDSFFTIATEAPINRQTFEDNLTIEPAIDYSLEWVNDNEVKITPTTPLTVDTEYKIILGVGTQIGKDPAIKDNLTWNFKTRPTFTVIGVTPIDGSESAPIDTAIEFEFNYSNINLESFNEHFTIEPKVEGKTELHEKKVVFLPNEKLNPYVDYKVTLTKGVKNEYQEETTKDISSTFSVQNYDKNHNYVKVPRYYYTPTKTLMSFSKNPFISVGSNDLTTPVLIKAYKIDENGLLEFLKEGRAEKMELTAEYTFTPKANDPNYVQIIDFTNLAKGLYLIKMSSEETQQSNSFILNYSDYGLYSAEGTSEEIFWIFNLANFTVNTEGSIDLYEETEKAFNKLDTVNIDAEGKATYGQHADLLMTKIGNQYAVVYKNKSDYYEEYNYEDYWIYGHQGNTVIGQESYRTYAFTDRPLYKPGDTVYFKMIIRKENDFNYTIPQGEKIRVTIPKGTIRTNYKGESEYTYLYDQELTINEFGTVSGEVVLPENETNSLNIYFSKDDVNLNYQWVNVTPFTKPQFDVSISTNKSEYLSGETASTQISINRYSGEPYTGDVEIKTCTGGVGTGAWPNAEYLNYEREYGVYGDCYNNPTTNTRTLRPDEFGQIKFEEVINFQSPEKNVGYYYTQVVIKGEGETDTIEERSVIVFENEIDIFVKSELYNLRVNDSNKITIGTFESGTDNAVGGVPFKAEIKRSWSEQKLTGTKYDSSTKKTVPVYTYISHKDTVQTFEGMTNDNGLYEYTYTPALDGSYGIILTMITSGNPTKEAESIFYVSKKEGASNNDNDESPIKFTVDKTKAKIGDEIVLTMKSNPDLTGTVEAVLIAYRGNSYSTEKFVIEKGATVTLTKEIDSNCTPAVFYALVFPKNYTFQMDQLSINLSAIAREEEAVNVKDESKKINIAVSSNKQVYEPGENAKFEIVATDQNGNGVETEFSIAAVDKALLETKKFFYTNDLFNQFYSVINQYVSFNNSNGQLTIAGGGGGGGEGSRNLFKDTAFWFSNVKTDSNGKASINADLPDNLTTWVLDIRGVSKDTHVGQTIYEFKVSKDFNLDFVLPQYVKAGDEINLMTRVSNYSGSEVNGTLSITLENGELLSDKKQSFSLNNKVSKFYYFRFKVQDADNLKVRIDADSNGSKLDAVEKSVQILPLAGITGRIENIIFDPNNTKLLFNIPETVILEKSIYKLYLSSSLLSEAIYANETPRSNSSIDLSAFIIKNIVLLDNYDLLKPDINKEVLIKQTEQAIKDLQMNQRSSGGFGWFSYDTENIDNSSTVMIALAKAENAGFTIPQFMKIRLIEYLEKQILSDESTYQDKTFAVYSLSEIHYENVLRYATYLVSKRSEFEKSPSTLAYLALALFNLDNTGDGITLSSMIEDIVTEETERWARWEEPSSEYNITKNTNLITALCFDVLRSYNRNLYQKAQNYIIENVDFAFGNGLSEVIILDSIVKHNKGSLVEQSGSVKVLVNGNEIQTISLEANSNTKLDIPATLLVKGDNEITIEYQDSGLNNVFAKLYASELTNITNKAINGMDISVIFKDLRTDAIKDKFEAGTPVVMEIIMTSSFDGSYAEVAGFIPAGFEILSTEFNYTTNEMMRTFYQNSYKASTWGNRKTYDQIKFSQYSVKSWETYKFRIPLIAKTKGTFSTTGASGYFINAPDINGQSGIKTVTVN